MAKNYGTIIITYEQTANKVKFFAEKMAEEVGKLLGVTLTIAQRWSNSSDYNILYGDKVFLNLAEYSSTSLYIKCAVSQTTVCSMPATNYNNFKILIYYIKSGNWCFLKFVGAESVEKDIGRFFLIRKNGTSLEVSYIKALNSVPFPPTTGNFEELYNINDSTTKQLYNSFGFDAPAGKIYVSNAILYDTSSSNLISEEKDILTCSNVGFDTNIRFNDKNYHAIAKNFVMEKTEG